MNESRLVIWFSYLDNDGNKETYTFRQDKENNVAFLEYIESVKVGLKAKGYTPLSQHANTSNGKTPATVAPTEAKFIDVLGIKLETGGDNPRFMTRGGNFVKFGITTWKESLQEIGIFDEIMEHFKSFSATDEVQDYAPEGLRAYYSEKLHNGEMKPDKVTSFVKV